MGGRSNENYLIFYLYVLTGAGGDDAVAFAFSQLTQVPCHGCLHCHHQEDQLDGQHPHITTTTQGRPTGQRHKVGSNSLVGEADCQSLTGWENFGRVANWFANDPTIVTTCLSIELTLSIFTLSLS